MIAAVVPLLLRAGAGAGAPSSTSRISTSLSFELGISKAEFAFAAVVRCLRRGFGNSDCSAAVDIAFVRDLVCRVFGAVAEIVVVSGPFRNARRDFVCRPDVVSCMVGRDSELLDRGSAIVSLYIVGSASSRSVDGMARSGRSDSSSLGSGWLLDSEGGGDEARSGDD